MIAGSLVRLFSTGRFVSFLWSPACTLGLLFFLFFLVSLLQIRVVEAQPLIVPERDLTLVSQHDQPPWKFQWDRARESVRNEQWQEALSAYEELLEAKEDVAEARWEYAQLLIQLENWAAATDIVANLLEGDSANVRYLAAGGGLGLETEEYERAAQLFGLLYEQAPDGPFALQALQGLVEALQGLDRKDVAFPLMEQLYLRTPDDEKLLRLLGSYALRLGKKEKARVYYAKLLSEFDGLDKDLQTAAKLFDEPHLRDQAVVYWLAYLERYPSYLRFQKKVAEYYLASDQDVKALDHLLVLLAHGDLRPELYLRVGEIYLQKLRRPDRALYYLKEYRKARPDDERVAQEINRIHVVLANDLLAIVQNDGAWQLWRDLAKITSDRLPIYSAMAHLLEQRGMQAELIEILEIIHQQEPTDQSVVLRLSELLLRADRLSESVYYLDLLTEEWQAGRRALLVKGRVSELLDQPYNAYHAYVSYLVLSPDDLDTRRRAMGLAFELDLTDSMAEHYGILFERLTEPEDRLALGLKYVNGLTRNRLYGRAQEALQDIRELGNVGAQGMLDLLLVEAQLLGDSGNYYAAEQLLRRGLSTEQDTAPVLRRLFSDALIRGDIDWAELWLNSQKVSDMNLSLSVDCSQAQTDLFFDQLQWLAASGKIHQAIDSALQYRQNVSTTEFPERLEKLLQLDLILLRLYYQAGWFESGRDLASEVLGRMPGEVELVILSALFESGGDDLLAANRIQSSFSDELLPSRLLQAAEFCYQYGLYDVGLILVRESQNGCRESVRAVLLEADILRHHGGLEEARLLLDELVSRYPNEEFFHRQRLELMFLQGEYPALIDALSSELSAVKKRGQVDEAAQNSPEGLSYWRHLLLARALWADRRHRDAVSVYERMLQPSVDQRFDEYLQQAGTELQLPLTSRSLLHKLTFTYPPEPDRLEVVMSPSFVLERAGEPEARISVDLYVDYRWQQLVVRELSARKAMTVGDDFLALHEYEALSSDQTTLESLFDLAGIYSRLGMLGREAAIYERIGRINPNYPGLADAVSRNNLKRQTRYWAVIDHENQKGRDDYIDQQRNSFGLGAWLMQDLHQEMELVVTRSFYESGTTDQNLWCNRFRVDYLNRMGDNLSLGLQVGVESQDSEPGVSPLFGLELRGRLGDWGEGYARFERDLVDDTLEALEQEIDHRDLGAGLMVNFLPRLQVGGEYRHRQFSDANQQNRYYVWGAYVLNREPLLLQLRYGYEYLHHSGENLGRDYSFEDGFQPGDHPYWSPGEFWQQLVGVHFKHQLAQDISGRGVPSYYTLDYSLGYESGGYDIHILNANIFLEIRPDFLLNTAVNIMNGSEYRREQGSLSLIYRW